MTSDRKTKRRWLLATAVYLGLLGAVSLQPAGDGPQDFIKEVVHNLLHVPAYAVLTWLLVRCSLALDRRRWMYVRAFVLSALWGIFMEVLQSFAPGRFPSVMDVGSNAFGSLSAIYFLRTTQHRM